jgi:hypothetical protein
MACPSREQLMDTVKTIAYRAGTTAVRIVREQTARANDARSLLRDLRHEHGVADDV